MRRPATALVMVGLGASLTGACATTTAGGDPHDVGARQHERIAAGEEAVARRHAELYDPAASVFSNQRCDRGTSARKGEGNGCWTSIANPTAVHLDEARKHRQMAADHRAASQALRDAEARACVGLSDADRDMSPFAHREDIASAEPLTVEVTSQKPHYTRTEGAVITFRAVPGMTAQWLQRVIDCHLAGNAALAYDTPEMAYCPLALQNVTARVAATGAGFAVTVRSEDPDTATEILRRARALVAH